MAAIRNILILAALTTASNLLPRTAAQIKSDLQTLDTDVNKCTNVCKSWNGSLTGAVALQNCEQQIESDLKALNTDCANTAAISSADAQAIVDYINNPLEPDVQAFIACLIQRKPDAVKNGYQGTIQKDLQNLKNLTTTAGNCLISKAPAPQKSGSQSAINKILADIQNGINNYA